MTTEKLTWEKKIDEVTASFNRINDRAGFAREFYENLFFINPKIKTYFAKTDFEHQEKALLRGLEYILGFLHGNNEHARQQVKRLAFSHSIHGLKIHPHHYYYWTEALVKTARDFDPYWYEKLDEHWREVIHYPVSFMISQYFSRDD